MEKDVAEPPKPAPDHDEEPIPSQEQASDIAPSQSQDRDTAKDDTSKCSNSGMSTSDSEQRHQELMATMKDLKATFERCQADTEQGLQKISGNFNDHLKLLKNEIQDVKNMVSKQPYDGYLTPSMFTYNFKPTYPVVNLKSSEIEPCADTMNFLANSRGLNASEKRLESCTLAEMPHYDDKQGLATFIWDPSCRSEAVPSLPPHAIPSDELEPGNVDPSVTSSSPLLTNLNSSQTSAESQIKAGQEKGRTENIQSPSSHPSSETGEKPSNKEGLRPHSANRDRVRERHVGPTPGSHTAKEKQKSQDASKPASRHSPSNLEPSGKAGNSQKGDSNGPESITSQAVDPPRDVRPKQPAFSRTATVASVSQTRSGRSKKQAIGQQITALGLNIFSSGEDESQRLRRAMDRARIPEVEQSPKSRSYDTVLCLDVSQSMWEGDAYDQMIIAAKKFIDGVEDMTSDFNMEENIAIVTFGGEANIVQHLTNDYMRVRDALERIEVGGKSPFFEAIVVCLSAFHGKGGTVSVSGVYDISPRIIFITDGHITEGSDNLEASDRVSDRTNTRASFSRLMMDISPKADNTLPHPVVFVPVGSKADRDFLESMSKLSEGLLLEAENIASLCNYFRVQGTIGKVIVCLRSKDAGTSDEQVKAVAQALDPDISKGDMAEVISTVQRELNSPELKRSRDTKPTDFDYVFENQERVASGDSLALGSRVVRGPDWQWGEQDGRGPGTVIQHEEKKHPFTWVMWDNGHWNRYPYGSDMGYHIWLTQEHPVLRLPEGQLGIGTTVTRGPQWRYKETEKRDSTEQGVVIRTTSNGKRVKVRWGNGDVESCSTNDLQVCDPFLCEENEDSTKGTSSHSEAGLQHTLDEEEEEENSDKVRVWQWRNDWGDWHIYTKDQNNALERAYQRKKDGSCVIQRAGKTFRVMFRRKVEKDINLHTQRDVQRILVSPEDYQSLIVAEELSQQ